MTEFSVRELGWPYRTRSGGKEGSREEKQFVNLKIPFLFWWFVHSLQDLGDSSGSQCWQSLIKVSKL